VDITDPLGVVNTLYTPIQIEAVPSGIWRTVEDLPDGWLQTAAYLDGVTLAVSSTVTVLVAGSSGEVHTVVYGNVQLGEITVCKFYDRDADGVKDADEPVIPGWRFALDGLDVRGTAVHLVGTAGANGCYTFGNLLPGSYTVSEIFPLGNWYASTATSFTIQLAEGAAESRQFGNFCTGAAAFFTKGFWHNVNGLPIITRADIDYVNTLAVYSGLTEYWNSGPFDGTWVPINSGNYFGTGAWAEISDYLTSPVSASPARFQLAQQLLAFIFNARHELDNSGATIQLPNGTWVSASSLISQAIALWQSGSDTDRNAMETLLDGLNNSSAVSFICYNPCPVVYP